MLARKITEKALEKTLNNTKYTVRVELPSMEDISIRIYSHDYDSNILDLDEYGLIFQFNNRTYCYINLGFRECFWFVDSPLIGGSEKKNIDISENEFKRIANEFLETL